MLSTILDRIYNACSYILYGEQSLSSMMCRNIDPNRLIQILQTKKDELNKTDEMGATPIIYAIMNHQSATIIQILLDHGADPTIAESSNDFNTLHFAINNLIHPEKYQLTKKEYIKIIQLLYKKSESLINQPEKNGITPGMILMEYNLLDEIIPNMDGIVHVRRSQHF